MLPGSMPFIGASEVNNGITAFVSNSNASVSRNILGVNYNGSVVENFYHPYACIFSDDVKRLKINKCDADKYVYIFLKVMLLKQKEKYKYGYKFNGDRMKKQKILLPIDERGRPDWSLMADVMKKGFRKKIMTIFSYYENREY